MVVCRGSYRSHTQANWRILQGVRCRKTHGDNRKSLRTPFPLKLEPTRIPFCQHNGKQFIIVSLMCSPNTLIQNCFQNLKSKRYTTKTSNCKGIETLAVFPVNSDIVIVNTLLPPFPLINVVMDLVMIFKVTSNNIERGRGFRNVLKFSICFQECVFSW